MKERKRGGLQLCPTKHATPDKYRKSSSTSKTEDKGTTGSGEFPSTTGIEERTRKRKGGRGKDDKLHHQWEKGERGKGKGGFHAYAFCSTS